MVEKSLCRHVALCAVGLCLALLFPVLVFAQETYVTGTVYDENDEPMMGVTVANREMSTGTATSMEGKYRVRASKGQVLTFSFVGYETQRITWSGTTPLDVHMRVNAETLDEVVVTALGIKREARSLGYSTENLDGESITHTMPSNWSSALSGKVSGLNIVSPGGPLGSTRVSLRGDISLNVDGNAALIVVDGVPMSSKISNPGVAYAAGGNSELSVDYGNGFADINPSDIADIQVLKGAGATALYGSRAANGAIIITTKNGSSGSRKGIGLSIYSWLTIFIYGRVVEFLSPENPKKAVFIVSSQVEPIRQCLSALGVRGSILHGRGMYEGVEREVLFIVAERKTLRRIRSEVRALDPKAFISTMDAGEDPLPIPKAPHQ